VHFLLGIISKSLVVDFGRLCAFYAGKIKDIYVDVPEYFWEKHFRSIEVEISPTKSALSFTYTKRPTNA
jgi:hypothetical protein